jgi:NDP-sugar pyrophosphorylase family protein
MKYQLVVPAGGDCTRMAELVDDKHKSLLRIDGDSMIRHLINSYCEAGLRRVVVLTGKHEESLREHLEQTTDFPSDIQIVYSRDPEVGKAGSAGAILNALKNKSIDSSMSMIVHNPDDLILSNSFARMFISAHEGNVKIGGVASLVVVSSPVVYVPFTLVTRNSSSAILTLKKGDFVSVTGAGFAHTGITLMNPQMFHLFEELVEEGKGQSFEPIVLSAILDKRELYTIQIRKDEWIAVNDPKSYQEARRRLGG